MIHEGEKSALAKGLSSRLGRKSVNNISHPGAVTGSNFRNYA